MKLIVCLVISSMLFMNGAVAQKMKTLQLTDTITQDPALKKGKLANGFTYYLRQDSNLKDRISIRVVVNAGERDEEDDQIELAHLLEHLVVKSTKNFPDVKSFLMSQKLVWGNDFNASTGGDQTTYRISIPSADTQLLKSCLLLVKDWVGGGVSMSADHIDPERGVILQELDRKSTPGLSAKMIALEEVARLPRNSRISMDIHEAVNSFRPEALQKFYNDWYTPDNAALIVSGNIDIKQLESMIPAMYADLKGSAKKSRKILPDPMAGHVNRYIGLPVDRHDRTECKIYFKIPYEDVHTYQHAKNALQRRLITHIMMNRLEPLESSNAAWSYFPVLSDFVQPVSMFIADNGDIKDAVQGVFHNIMYEVRRLEKYGVDKWELDTMRRWMLSELEKDAGKPQDVNDYDLNFQRNTPIPGNQHKYAYSKYLLDNLSVDELNRFIRDLQIGKNRDIVIITPEAKKHTLPSESTVNEWLKQVSNAALTPFVPKKQPEVKKDPALKVFPPLMTRKQLRELDKKKPTGLQQEELPSLGITKIQLPNGITLIFKPTGDNSSRIYVDAINITDTYGYAKSGIDSAAALCAGRVVNGSGAGVLNDSQWTAYKSAKGIKIGNSINGNNAMFLGESNPQDLEILLQGLHVLLMDPKVDTASLSKWKAQSIADNDMRNVAIAGRNDAHFIASRNFLDITISNESIRQVNEKVALAAYKRLFSNTGNFTFLITGNIDVAKSKMLFSKYLGTIPVSSKVDPAVQAGKGMLEYHPIKKVLDEGENQTSTVAIYFPGIGKDIAGATFFLDVIQYQMKIALLNRLRIKEGISYSPRANGLLNGKYTDVSMFISAGFDCKTDRVDDAVKYVQEEFRRIQREGFKTASLDEARTVVLNSFGKQMKDARSSRECLTNLISSSTDLREIDKHLDGLRFITPEAMAKFTSRFLVDSCSVIVMHPKYASGTTQK